MRVSDFSILFSKAACSGGIPNKRGVELSIHASKAVYFESISRAFVGKQAQPQLCKFTLKLRLRGETNFALPRGAYSTCSGVCPVSVLSEVNPQGETELSTVRAPDPSGSASRKVL